MRDFVNGFGPARMQNTKMSGAILPENQREAEGKVFKAAIDNIPSGRGNPPDGLATPPRGAELAERRVPAADQSTASMADAARVRPVAGRSVENFALALRQARAAIDDDGEMPPGMKTSTAVAVEAGDEVGRMFDGKAISVPATGPATVFTRGLPSIGPDEAHRFFTNDVSGAVLPETGSIPPISVEGSLPSYGLRADGKGEAVAEGSDGQSDIRAPQAGRDKTGDDHGALASFDMILTSGVSRLTLNAQTQAKTSISAGEPDGEPANDGGEGAPVVPGPVVHTREAGAPPAIAGAGMQTAMSSQRGGEPVNTRIGDRSDAAAAVSLQPGSSNEPRPAAPAPAAHLPTFAEKSAERPFMASFNPAIVKHDPDAPRIAPVLMRDVTSVESRTYSSVAPGQVSATVLGAMSDDAEWTAALRHAPAASTTPLDAARGVAKSLKIQLSPVELGMVTATLRMAGGQLSIEIQVETIEAYRQLSDDNNAMQRALRGQGYDVDRVSVHHVIADRAAGSGGPPSTAPGGSGTVFGDSQNPGGAATEGRSSDSGRGRGDDGGRSAREGPASAAPDTADPARPAGRGVYL